MEMTIRFPDGDRVDASWGDLTVTTHQDGTAPAPFELFLASIGTCTGIYVSRFLRQRGLPVADVELRQSVSWDPGSRRLDRIAIEIELPPGFPEPYRDAVVRAAQLCAVKKTLENPPPIEVRTVGPRPVSR